MSELSRFNTLFHEYSSDEVVAVAKSKEAFANEVFDITTSDKQRYFLKVLKSQHPDAIQQEVVMQKRLIAAGISSPEYIEISPGNYVGKSGDERFTLTRYIPGSAPKTVSPRLVESFGETLAKFHACLDGMSVVDNKTKWYNPAYISQDLEKCEDPVKPSIESLINYGLPIFDLGLPKSVIHGDLWLSNVFAENDCITTVFDLDTVEETLRIFDIARTYTSLRFNSDYSTKQVIDGLVAGYNSKTEIPLSSKEMDNMMRAIAYVCGAFATWHAVHKTRYRDPYIKLGKESMIDITKG
jgi:Ser/Thr protein kinase RdoA (MazF antagonist)